MHHFLFQKNGSKQSNMAEELVQKKRSGKKIIGVIIIIIIIIAGYFVFMKIKNSNNISNVVVDSSKYQAVFLSNGQTYFGKVANPDAKYVSLSNVYYLIQSQPLQSQTNANQQNQDPTKPQYSLIKLGQEMHGPTSMSINKDQILFIENLSDDSKVVTAIKNQK